MSTISFIHAADLHLGAPFKGLRASSPLWADVLLSAIPDAYRRIVDTAVEKRVDFVVIAGDIFDDSRPSYADFSLFVQGLRKLQEADIPVYFVTGNHDPFTSWDNGFSSLPANAHLLGAGKPGFAVYRRDGEPLALIGGRGYFNQSWPSDVDISEAVSRETAQRELGVEAPFMIGVLHTGLDIDPTRSPVSPHTLPGARRCRGSAARPRCRLLGMRPCSSASFDPRCQEPTHCLFRMPAGQERGGNGCARGVSGYPFARMPR